MAIWKILTLKLNVFLIYQRKSTMQKNVSHEISGERDRIKDLDKQVRSLQIENVFLKELRKLRKGSPTEKQESVARIIDVSIRVAAIKK